MNKKIIKNIEKTPTNILGIIFESSLQKQAQKIMTQLKKNNLINKCPTKIMTFLKNSSEWINIPQLNVLHLFLGIVHTPLINNVYYKISLEDKVFECKAVIINGYWRITEIPLLRTDSIIDVKVDNENNSFEVAWISMNIKFDYKMNISNIKMEELKSIEIIGTDKYFIMN